MKLSHEEVRHLARLIRLGLDNDEIEKLSEQISNILENFEILQRVDTSNVMPTAHSIALENVTRDDEIEPSLPIDKVLANAPDREDNYLKVRAVLEQ